MRNAGVAQLALGTLAVMAGAAFLWVAGALPGMASRNIGSFLLGLLLGWGLHHAAHRRTGAEILFALASASLLAVLLVGIELEGVKRWIPLGPLHVQPALILAPLLLALAASREGRHWRALVLIPVGLIAAQPDGATAMALAAGVVALMAAASGRARRGWSQRRIAIAAGAFILVIVSLIVAGMPTPPPVAFVEGTTGIALLSGAPAMALHFIAIALMLAALLYCRDPAGASLAAYFTVSVLAAIFMAFPMPIAGAGPSHLIGFGIAIGWLAVRDRIANQIQPARS
jgi:cell division protein FtsW (lipid II flippase)